MNIIQRIIYNWKHWTNEERAKWVLSLLCDIGCGLLSTKLNDTLNHGNKVSKALSGIALFGLGSAASEVASQNICDLVDIVVDVVKQQKEEKANA